MKALELLYQYQQEDEIAVGYMSKSINEAIKELEALATSTTQQTTQSKFKVGDWVVHQEAEHPWKITQNSLDKLDNTELKLWKPNIGEWVWINTRADTLPFIACLLKQIKVDNTFVFTDYSYTSKGKRKDILIHPDELISLEPFIGELPSFIYTNYNKGTLNENSN